MNHQPLRLHVDPFSGVLPDDLVSLSIEGTVSGALAGAPDAVVNVQVGNRHFNSSLQPADGDLPRRWTATISTAHCDPGRHQIVVAAHAGHEVVTDRFDLEVVSLHTEPPRFSGYFDTPEEGEILTTDALRVAGWCLFHGSTLSKVDVVVNGRRVTRARCFTERPDVEVQFPDRDAPVAGFTILIPVDLLPAADEYLVSVEATSLDGRRWCSDTRRVLPRPTPDTDGGPYVAALRQRTRTLAQHSLSHPSRPKVAVVTHDLGYGGGQLWLSELLRQFQLRDRFDIQVISMADGPLRVDLERSGIPVHVTAPSHIATPQGHEDRVAELTMLMRHFGCSAALVNTVLLFQAVEAAEVAGLPVIWAIHESFPPSVYSHIVWGANIHPYVFERFKDSMRQADALVFEASQTADLFAPHSVPGQRFVVDYGVDVDEIDRYRASIDRDTVRAGLGWGADDLVLLVVGVFGDRKAQAAAVAAFDELADVDPRIRLALVGHHEAPYCRAVVEQVGRARHSDRIRIEPITPDIHRWYAIADLLVCASDIESLPRSILEAMAFELPVASTDVFGVASLLTDGETGWLTRVNDLRGLAGMLAHVVALDSGERHAVARAARADVERRADEDSYGLLIADALDALMKDRDVDLQPLLGRRRARREATR